MFSVPIFKTDERVYVSLDVLLFAATRGRLSGVEQALVEAEACRLWAESEGHENDGAQLQAASESYRESLGLTSANATQAWLNGRGVTLDEFVDYLDRAIWRQRVQGDINALLAQFAPDEEQRVELIWPETVFSGALDSFAASLARRVAIAAEEKEQGETTPDTRAPLAPEAETWARRLGAREGALDELAALNAVYARRMNTLLERERIQRELEHRRLEFLRVRVETMTFADENVANEAYWCVTQEGESLETFCAATAAPAHCYSALLAELPEPLQRQFLSGADGQVFEPIRTGEGFTIFQLHHKVEPDPADPNTRARLERDIAGKYVEGLIQKHVEWLIA